MQDLMRMVALTVALTGCATHSERHNEEAQQETMYQICPEQRLPICTQEYRPVCGQTDDGAQHTYGNACTACADEQVYAYVPGECE